MDMVCLARGRVALPTAAFADQGYHLLDVDSGRQIKNNRFTNQIRFFDSEPIFITADDTVAVSVV